MENIWKRIGKSVIKIGMEESPAFHQKANKKGPLRSL
jgi:hypothetical protein